MTLFVRTTALVFFFLTLMGFAISSIVSLGILARAFREELGVGLALLQILPMTMATAGVLLVAGLVYVVTDQLERQTLLLESLLRNSRRSSRSD